MVSKKGMSPIIATILLIAFAVALGAMIMNWSSNLVKGGMLEDQCAQVDVRLRTPLCYQNNAVKVDTINTGDVKIAGLILRLESSQVGTQETLIPGSEMEQDAVLTKNIPSIRPEGQYAVSLIPKVTVHDEAQACKQPIKTTGNLSAC
jgi:flagellin-like protein